MKVMKAKAVTAMPKGAINDALATKTGLEKKAVAGVIGELASLATAEVKKTGKFTLPGLCMLKTRIRPARALEFYAIWGPRNFTNKGGPQSRPPLYPSQGREPHLHHKGGLWGKDLTSYLLPYVECPYQCLRRTRPLQARQLFTVGRFNSKLKIMI